MAHRKPSILPKTLPSPDVEDFSSAGPMWLEADDGLHVSGRPRCLRSINPTVTFILRCDSVIAESRFTVFFAAPVIDVSVDGCLYSTLLVPEYWETISDSLDPTQFTIYQEIARIDNSTIVFSATYKSATRKVVTLLFSLLRLLIPRVLPIPAQTSTPSLLLPLSTKISFAVRNGVRLSNREKVPSQWSTAAHLATALL
ncbi:hypothetical protein R3P38DRAFT_2815707 [Favolaschia claudopus]|uniref:Uncharacterized protein n=1 Tax=Favolaschia claudopus TaxID=2862362 RepID=A0AAV9Z0P2_9AGAR